MRFYFTAIKGIITIFMLCICLFASAQKKITINLALENSVPVGYFKDYYTFGIGPAAGIDYRIIGLHTIYFTVSYLDYFINSSTLGVSGSETFMPMVFGVKPFLTKNIYLLAGAGVNLDFGSVITAYHVYHAGIGSYVYKGIAADIKYERTGTFDFTPKVIKFRISYTFGKRPSKLKIITNPN